MIFYQGQTTTAYQCDVYLIAMRYYYYLNNDSNEAWGADILS